MWAQVYGFPHIREHRETLKTCLTWAHSLTRLVTVTGETVEQITFNCVAIGILVERIAFATTSRGRPETP